MSFVARPLCRPGGLGGVPGADHGGAVDQVAEAIPPSSEPSSPDSRAFLP